MMVSHSDVVAFIERLEVLLFLEVLLATFNFRDIAIRITGEILR